MSGGTLCATSIALYNTNRHDDYPNSPKNALFWGYMQIGSASSQIGSASSQFSSAHGLSGRAAMSIEGIEQRA